MQQVTENPSGGPRAGASKQRPGGPRTDGGQRNGRQKKTSSQKGSNQRHSDPKSQKAPVFPLLNMSSVSSVPPIAAGPISQTPRVTAGISFKDVLTSRVGTVQTTPELPRAQRSERTHQAPGRNESTLVGGGRTATTHVSPGPHPRPNNEPRTRTDDTLSGNSSISIAMSRLESQARADEGGVDLLALSHAVLDGCRLLGTPRMIIDMLEVHQQNLRTHKSRRTSEPPASASASRSAPYDQATRTTPSPVPADVVATVARIKDKLAICDDLLIATV